VLEAGGSSAFTCSICFEDYASGDLMRVLPCAHRFHVTCIDRWLLTKVQRSDAGEALSCPLCNTALR